MFTRVFEKENFDSRIECHGDLRHGIRCSYTWVEFMEHIRAEHQRFGDKKPGRCNDFHRSGKGWV